jgi:probable F420-dependent oxidoreductase
MKIAGPFPFSGPLATRDTVAEVAKTVERLGYDFIWMGEHIYYPKVMRGKYPYTKDGSLPVQPVYNYFEIVTTLTWVAAHTSRLRLHTNILMPAVRSPFLAAKQLATLDYLSGGRLNLALGLGWMIDEYELVGTPWSERGRYLDEWIVALRAYMAGEAFAGDYFRFEEAWFEPKPAQDPLPIWIGGDSDAAVKRAATLGTGWEPVGPGDAREKSAWLKPRLQRIAELRGGAMDGFGVLTSCGYQGVEQGASAWRAAKGRLMDQIGVLAEAGVTHLIVRFNELNAPELGPIMDEAQWFAEDLLPWARGL